MRFMTEINEDIECLKYVFKHLGVGGSTIRLARMARMMWFATLILAIIVLYLMW